MNEPASIAMDRPSPDSLQAELGTAIHALNLAIQQIERLGGDASIQREVVAELMSVRWAK